MSPESSRLLRLMPRFTSINLGSGVRSAIGQGCNRDVVSLSFLYLVVLVIQSFIQANATLHVTRVMVLVDYVGDTTPSILDIPYGNMSRYQSPG